jgi:hypothetical protein
MEFWFALWGNARGFLVFAAVVSVLVVVSIGLVWLLNSGTHYEDWNAMADRAKRLLPKAVACAVATLLLACLPDLDDLWRTRISLIKYELAAPENVKAATETIERIGKKLECKYLGGCEEPKPESAR